MVFTGTGGNFRFVFLTDLGGYGSIVMVSGGFSRGAGSIRTEQTVPLKNQVVVRAELA